MVQLWFMGHGAPVAGEPVLCAKCLTPGSASMVSPQVIEAFSAGAKTICGPSRRNVPKRYYHKMVMALADVAYNLDMLRTPAKMLPRSAITMW